MKNILLLASQSKSRRMLLSQAQIPFVLIDQAADESQCDWGLPLPQLVESIAQYKMSQVIMPLGVQKQELFVITADTLTQNVHGVTFGKPENEAHAMEILKTFHEGRIRINTAVCLDKKVYKYDTWQTDQRVILIVEGQCMFKVPHALMQQYIQNSAALSAAGALAIEGYGAQFLQSVSGSYNTIIGLPLFELRQALYQLGFF